MRHLLLALALAQIAPAAFAQNAPWPDGYWERQYGYGQPWSVVYMVNLKVDAPAEAREKAVKLLEQSGGRPTQNGAYGGYGRSLQYQQVSYYVPIEKAEKAAKRLFSLGDLQQFSTQKAGAATQLPEIREKIASLEAERKAGAAKLESLPIARTLLAAQLAKLTQTRDSLEAGAGTALVNVTLSDASSPDYRGGRHKVAVPVPQTPTPPNEGQAKGSLGALRSALSIYYGDLEGRYPSSFADLTAGGKYLTAVPRIRVHNHAETDAVTVYTGVKDLDSLKAKLKDTGGWAYVADPRSPLLGNVVVDCKHVDSRGHPWADY